MAATKLAYLYTHNGTKARCYTLQHTGGYDRLLCKVRPYAPGVLTCKLAGGDLDNQLATEVDS
jgi:hypothetical protein